MKIYQKFIILLIIIAAFSVRLYKLNAPVADWHSWRQADTASVARNFLKTGFDPLRPRYDDLSNIPSGRDNPQGWRMVEFPLYQLMSAGLTNLLPFVPVEISLRLVSIFSIMGTILIIFFISSRMYGYWTGLFAAFLYAFLPYSVYYGRTILPENLAVFLALFSIYCLYIGGDAKTKNKRNLFIWTSSVFSALSILVKPYSAFLLLPNIVLMLRLGSLKKMFGIGLIYITVSLFPFWWWRTWISQFPEGIPVYEWLFNGGNIRFKGAWFYWLFAERLSKLILGYWGMVLFGLGALVMSAKKDVSILRLVTLGAVLYITVIARGNVQHDYYQILTLPAVVLLSSAGAYQLSKILRNRFHLLSAILIIMLFAAAFSWYTVRTYFWINRPEIVEAGKTADSILPQDAKVIAPYNGDTTFLYQTNRQGWPIGFEIPKKMDMGATHYVTVSNISEDFEAQELMAKYQVLVQNEKFVIIDLTKKK